MRLVLLFALLAWSELSSAQYMEFEWSDEYRYSNRKSGFFSEFIGTSQTSIYLLQRNISKSKPYDNSKLAIVALSKNTLAEDTLVPIKGFPANVNLEKQLESMDFVKAIVADGKVIVFWRKLCNTDSTRTEEIYAQTYKSDLMPGLPLKKVFEFVQEVEDQPSVFDPTMCVVLTNNESGRIVLGTEKFKDGTIEFQYVTMTSGLSSSPLKKVLLPQKSLEIPESITSTYDLASNDNIYIRSIVPYTKEELWEMEPYHARTYLGFTVAKVESAEHCTVKIESEGKTITDYDYQSAGGNTRIIGFFGDLTEDTTGIDNQGLFYADVNNQSLSQTELNFISFEKPTLRRLYAKKKRKPKTKDTDEERILQTRFDVEHIEAMSDSSLVIFFTREYNYLDQWSRSDLNGENVYESNSIYYKDDVSAMRLSSDGEILWTRSLEREAMYEGNDVADIRVLFKYDEFFVIYGNELAKLKSPRGKKNRHLTSEMEYATFDPNSGRAKVESTEVNEPKTEKRDMHYLDPNSAVVIDGQFYFMKMRVRQNPLWTAANVVCFPTIYYSVLTGNTKAGKAEFTMMRVMDGKRPRKRK